MKNMWAKTSIAQPTASTAALHQKTVQHKQALLAKNVIGGKVVPSKEMFRKVLDKLRSGDFSARALAKLYGWSKEESVKLKWCLGEACRRKTAAFLRSPGVVLTVNQDARSHWLCVRFTGCNDALQKRQGLVAFIDMRHWLSSTSENIVAATTRAFFICLKKLNFAEKILKDPTPSELEIVMAALCGTEVFGADAASNEYLAGHILKGRKLDDIKLETPMMPNLIFVHKDKAHASRRLTSRGWGADPYLKAVHSSVVGKGCFVQRIQNSTMLQAVFNTHVQTANLKHVRADRVRDVGAIQPRFETCQKPLIRRSLHHEALLATAVVVSRGRHGRDEADAANQFLREETSERATQAAMMADGGDECLCLTRFLEPELFDTTKFAKVLADHHARMRGLFMDGLCLESGATGALLRSLKEAPKTVMVNGSVKTIGSPSADVVDRCLGRMAAWVRLGESISEAEFPFFEPLQCFSVFNLESKNLDADISDKLARLCNVLGLVTETARDEYFFYLPIARMHFKPGADVFECWREAVRDPRSRGQLVSHGSTLRQLLKRLGAWSGSTMECERLLSKHKRIATEQRKELVELGVNADAALVTMDPADADDVIKIARKLWALNFGTMTLTVENGRKRRRDLGVKKKRKQAR